MTPISVLSDIEIKSELLNNNIIIHPFTESQLSNTSYDVTLGNYYFSPIKSNGSSHFKDKFYNPWFDQHVLNYWGSPLKAKTVADYPDILFEGLSNSDEIIIIEPRETILCHTLEFIGGLNHITTMMKARSSIGRSSLSVCKCAGWGDVNYVNRWTMEITNHSDINIILPVGKKIAQIVFFYTGSTSKPYTGKYQSSSNLDHLIHSWTPSMMLPKLYLDHY